MPHCILFLNEKEPLAGIEPTNAHYKCAVLPLKLKGLEQQVCFPVTYYLPLLEVGPESNRGSLSCLESSMFYLVCQPMLLSLSSSENDASSPDLVAAIYPDAAATE